MIRGLARNGTRTHADNISTMEEPKIIYENENFVAVCKPAGMLTHPARINADNTQTDADFTLTNAEISQRKSALRPRESATLTRWLLKKYPEMKNVGDEPEIRPGIVHRLDRETSGILLAARNQKYFEYLKSLFKTRRIEKTYIAVVLGAPKERTGVIDKTIRRKKDSVKRTTFLGKTSKEAVTRYTVKRTFETADGVFSFLEVIPETGRTHQIRVHLASIGHPVVGDILYGPKPKTKNQIPNTRLMLHARSLEFSAEDGKRIKIECEPPREFADFSQSADHVCPR